MVVGVGQSQIPASLIGSILIHPSLIIIPKYLIFVFLNLHYFALKNRLFSEVFPVPSL